MHAKYFQLLCIFIVPLSAFAQEERNSDLENKQLMKKCYRDFAASIKFSIEGGDALKFIDKSVLSWTGSENDDFSSGDVFVWVLDGRPQLIACIGSIPSSYVRGARDIFQEYHSLSENPFKDRHMGKKKHWAPRRGVQLRPLDTGVEVAKSASLRFAQMRELASRFKGRMPYQAQEQRLRVMRQPIYRYDTEELEKHGSAVVDGAIFAFVWSERGTDPELLVMLECHKEGSGLIWKYSPVRFTHRSLSLDYQGKEVWSIGRRDRAPTAPFYLDNITHLSFDEIRKAVASKKAITSNSAY